MHTKQLKNRYFCQKSATCQNDQNFMNIKNTQLDTHAKLLKNHYFCKKSATCQNDQNFMKIKNTKLDMHVKKVQHVKMVRISQILKAHD